MEYGKDLVKVQRLTQITLIDFLHIPDQDGQQNNND
jgi:hypothetical protein